MSAASLSAESIAARIERLPVTGWHLRMRTIVGAATFFDAFDALTIAFVLPALIGAWHLNGGQIGVLISGGYVGQLFGAIFFGWLAERYGRRFALTWTVVVISVMSIACALASDYQSLLAFRLIQGLGLGGEVPVAAAYINEFAKAERRGGFVLYYQCIFPVGIVAVSLLSLFIVPRFGWQWMFVIGALPAILAVVLRRVLPESPRWLASRGRLEDADRELGAVEAAVSENGTQPLPPIPANVPPVAQASASWTDLFGGIYLARTIPTWILWFCAAFVGYGITIWLPTIYRTVFNLPVPEALRYSLISNVALIAGTLICAYMIDRAGRRATFTTAFACGGVALLVLWLLGLTSGLTVAAVVIMATVASLFASMLQLGLFLYTPEIYPTRIRALGCGSASGWTRIATIVGPPVVGAILQGANLAAVFLLLGATALVGAAVMYLFGIETRGRLLEEISP